MGNYIKNIISSYTKKYNTNDPFELADYINVEVQIGNLAEYLGCYMYLKKHRCIFLNKDLQGPMLKTVMAHELGHAILDPKENCYFMNSKTLLLTSKIERRANLFAAELLIDDRLILEYKDYTKEQLSIITGYDIELINLKLI